MELVDIDSLHPAAYNPREADEARLDLLGLSLRKLGFVLPLFAVRGGRLLSGHQRQVVGRRMGLRQVPVQFLDLDEVTDERACRAWNVVFNKVTNDTGKNESGRDMAADAELLRGLAESLPDLESEAMFPCLSAVSRQVSDLISANPLPDSCRYMTAMCRGLIKRGVGVPLVACGDVVVNGLGRLYASAEGGLSSVQCVEVSEDQAEFARLATNRLTMDFNFGETSPYADFLRYNSFRRSAGAGRESLGIAYRFAMGAGSEFDPHNSRCLRQWLDFYGQPVLDFGAGRMMEANVLRGEGVEVDVFEPYCLDLEDDGRNEIDVAKSRAISVEFLAQVASGKAWRSVFCNAVLNSVPFRGDREKVVRILAALCLPGTSVYAQAASAVSQRSVVRAGESMSAVRDGVSVFAAGYEPNVYMGSLYDLPKVQKYHTEAEFSELFGAVFQDVAVSDTGLSVTAAARKPRPVRKSKLAEALRFEFNLPYPSGERMGMGDQAVEAFSKRLGIRLE